MTKSAFTSDGFPYKLCLDGFDLLRLPFFEEVIFPSLSELSRQLLTKHTFQNCLPDVEGFVQEAQARRRLNEPNHPLPVHLRDKYEIGLWKVGDFWPGGTHVVVCPEAVQAWKSLGIDVSDLLVLVAPSRNRFGDINDIGFRIINTASVHDAVKWFWLSGQRATYGLQHSDITQPITLVEGVFDYIALTACGAKNVVGLGAAELSRAHKQQLSGATLRYCFDQDTFGLAQRAGQESSELAFFSPEGKDPFDAWITHGFVSLVLVASSKNAV